MAIESKRRSTNIITFSSFVKVVYTLVILSIHMIFGISASTFGPTFVDLKHILNTSMNRITLFSSFLSFGCIIGSFFGLSYTYLNRQMTLTVLLLLMSITSTLIPYSNEIWHLYLCIWVYGLGAGAWNNAHNVWLIEIWQQKSAPVLQLSQFMFGIGTILGPLIDRPYLTGEHQHDFSETSISNSTINTFKDEDIVRRTKLIQPFLIVGIIQLIGPLILTIMFLIRKYEFTSETEKIKTDNTSLGKEKAGVGIIILLSIFLAFSNISEQIYIDYSATFFQYIPLKLTASKSAEIVSAMGLFFTIGRGISVFTAIKIKPQLMIACHLSIIIVGIFILYSTQNSSTLIYIGCLFMSFGFSPMFPVIFAFTGQYMNVTDRIGTVLVISANILYLFVPFILGTFIEEYPNVFLLAIFSNLSISIFVFIIILCLVMNTPKYSVEYSLLGSDE